MGRHARRAKLGDMRARGSLTARGRKAAWLVGAALLLAGAWAVPAAAAPSNTQPPGLGWWLGEATALANQCDAGQWSPNPDQYRYTWVLDPGASEQVLATVTTGSGSVTRTSTPEQVNHDITCRVEASSDGGSTFSAPLEASGDPGASRVPPLVGVTVNGTQITGDVGGSLSAPSTVQVQLRRDGGDGTQRIVDSAPVAAMDQATGQWTATLPSHAPADDRDWLVLDYSGPAPVAGSATSSGVPADATIALRDLSGVRLWASASGDQLRALVPQRGQGGACPKATAHTPWGDIAGVGDNPDPFATSQLTFDLSGHPATDQDAIDIELIGRFWGNSGALLPATLSITKAAPMLGAGELGTLSDANSAVDVRAAPQCVVLLYDVTQQGPAVACFGLASGANLQLVHRRGATTLETVPFTSGGDLYSTPLATAVQSGDVITLRMAAAPQRVLASVTAATLRLDLGPKNADGWTTPAGDCAPAGRWIGAASVDSGIGDLLCGAGGTPIGQEADELVMRSRLGTDAIVLLDDRAGGGTAVAPPSVTATVPADSGAMWGATWSAYADTDTMAFPWSASGIAVEFGYRVRTDPLSTTPFTVVGNANASTGLAVSGLAPGRYDGRWRITDPHGDTRTLETIFMQQPLIPGLVGPSGPEGPAGPAGPAGIAGPAGPAGADGQLVLVAYQASAAARRVRVRYALTGPAAITLSVRRGTGAWTRVARSSGVAGLNTISWNRRIGGRRALAGRYTLRVSAAAGGRTASSTLSVRLR
jgi:hypothetical protein